MYRTRSQSTSGSEGAPSPPLAGLWAAAPQTNLLLSKIDRMRPTAIYTAALYYVHVTPLVRQNLRYSISCLRSSSSTPIYNILQLLMLSIRTFSRVFQSRVFSPPGSGGERSGGEGKGGGKEGDGQRLGDTPCWKW